MPLCVYHPPGVKAKRAQILQSHGQVEAHLALQNVIADTLLGQTFQNFRGLLHLSDGLGLLVLPEQGQGLQAQALGAVEHDFGGFGIGQEALGTVSRFQSGVGFAAAVGVEAGGNPKIRQSERVAIEFQGRAGEGEQFIALGKTVGVAQGFGIIQQHVGSVRPQVGLLAQRFDPAAQHVTPAMDEQIAGRGFHPGQCTFPVVYGQPMGYGFFGLALLPKPDRGLVV